MESITRNIDAVLNAKAGYSSVVNVFGLGRYDAYFANKELIETLIAEMLLSIRNFEPRLLSPRLMLVGRDRTVWAKFSLTGTVGDTPVTFDIRFHTIFRNVEVKRV